MVKGKAAADGPKRHQKKDVVLDLKKKSFKNVARKSGILRTSKLYGPAINENVKGYLRNLAHKSVDRANLRKKKTVSVDDVTQSARGKGGATLLGFSK